MKILILLILGSICFTACSPKRAVEREEAIFSGRVEYFYYTDATGATDGFTRFEKGLPGTSTMVKEDVWVDVYPSWVKVKLKNRKDYSYVIPTQRVVEIIVGTKEGNDLNLPR